MASVWYVGNAMEREVFGVQFDRYNGFSLPESVFTSQQLAALDADSGFLLGQVDGPRAYPDPPADGSPQDPAWPYFSEVQRMHDELLTAIRNGWVADNAVTTAKILDDAVTAAKLADYSVPYDICYMAAGKANIREIGTLENPLGLRLSQSIRIESVIYRCVTADASGSLAVEIQRNGVTEPTSAQTLPAANQINGIMLSGLSINFEVGDILTVNVTGVGGIPGRGLTADIKAKARNL